ncbi:hypothetical protein Scep_001880 [Stephania cephalantha]|uniref:Uncharacterized protein n=1 Tax=Stephania cephalantha TaxID=152367 RepID=A0AAP0Q5G8_9MAGN
MAVAMEVVRLYSMPLHAKGDLATQIPSFQLEIAYLLNFDMMKPDLAMLKSCEQSLQQDEVRYGEYPWSLRRYEVDLVDIVAMGWSNIEIKSLAGMHLEITKYFTQLSLQALEQNVFFETVMVQQISPSSATGPEPIVSCQSQTYSSSSKGSLSGVPTPGFASRILTYAGVTVGSVIQMKPTLKIIKAVVEVYKVFSLLCLSARSNAKSVGSSIVNELLMIVRKHINLVKKKAKNLCDPSAVPSEPFFVARPGAIEEDDGEPQYTYIVDN